VDDPLRLTGDPAAPGQGRMALWPDSTAHPVSTAGSLAFAGAVGRGHEHMRDSISRHVGLTGRVHRGLERPRERVRARPQLDRQIR
jgi:hypothetical protein